MSYRHFLITLCAVALVVALPPEVNACETTTTSEGVGDTAAIEYSSDIQLSELFPAPSSAGDAEEFIELVNIGDETVDLAGWSVADASGKKYIIAADDFISTSVGVDEFFVIPQSTSGISLNNSGDTITVLQPNHTVLDNTTYATAAYDTSWARVKESWQWSTTITENAANIFTAAADDAQNNDETEQNAAEEDTDDDVGDTIDTSKYQTASTVRLSELLPNPSGLDSTDEWIEIVNEGVDDVYIGGWQITDESDYYTAGDVTLAAGEYLTFEIAETGITLNNSGDKLFLIDPFGVILQGVEYGAAAEGESWARIGDGWQWTTTLTSNDTNVWNDENATAGDDATDSTEGADDSENTADADVVGITTFRSLEDSTTATIEGVVTVLPDVLGSQYFYVQDDEAGVQVYSYSKDFPELAVGDRVRVTGEKSTSRNETRIKISTHEDIVVIAHDEQVIARDAAELEESLEGMLVQVEGVVVDSSSSEAVIDDLVKIVLKSTASIDDGLLEEGTSVAVVGIVGQYDSEYRLMPRGNEDIAPAVSETSAFIQPAEAATHTRADGGLSLSKTNARGSSMAIAVAVIIGLLAIIGGMVIRHHRAAVLAWVQQNIAGEARSRSEPKQIYSTIFQALRKKQTPAHDLGGGVIHNNQTLTNAIKPVKEERHE